MPLREWGRRLVRLMMLIGRIKTFLLHSIWLNSIWIGICVEGEARKKMVRTERVKGKNCIGWGSVWSWTGVVSDNWDSWQLSFFLLCRFVFFMSYPSPLSLTAFLPPSPSLGPSFDWIRCLLFFALAFFFPPTLVFVPAVDPDSTPKPFGFFFFSRRAFGCWAKEDKEVEKREGEVGGDVVEEESSLCVLLCGRSYFKITREFSLFSFCWHSRAPRSMAEAQQWRSRNRPSLQSQLD